MQNTVKMKPPFVTSTSEGNNFNACKVKLIKVVRYTTLSQISSYINTTHTNKTNYR